MRGARARPRADDRPTPRRGPALPSATVGRPTPRSSVARASAGPRKEEPLERDPEVGLGDGRGQLRGRYRGDAAAPVVVS
eukprot:9257593-Pyramimonas_sp.AAC.1